MWSTTQRMSIEARSFMATRLYTARPDERVWDVVRTLVKKGYSGCPVVEGERLVGVISEHDCIRALTRAVHDQLPPAYVADVMTTDPVTIPPDAQLLTIAHLFTEKRLKRLPVVEGDRLVGQVSRRDLLQHAIKVFESHRDRQAAVLFLSAIAGTQPPVPRRG